MEDFNQIFKIFNLAFTFTRNFIQYSYLRARAYLMKLDTKKIVMVLVLNVFLENDIEK